MVVRLAVEKAFDHVDRLAFKAMRLQSLSPFSIALIAAIWNGSFMKTRLGTTVKQSSNEPWFTSRCTRVSRHLHNDHGIGIERSDRVGKFGNWHGACSTLCWLRFAMRPMW